MLHNYKLWLIEESGNFLLGTLVTSPSLSPSNLGCSIQNNQNKVIKDQELLIFHDKANEKQRNWTIPSRDKAISIIAIQVQLP